MLFLLIMSDNNLLNFLKFKKILGFAYKNKFSDFYHAKYNQAGFNPLTEFRSMDDIEKIPLLAKKEFSQKPSSAILFVREKEISSVSLSSGTTGNPTPFFHSKPEKSSLSHHRGIDFGRVLILRNSLFANRESMKVRDSGHPAIVGDIHDLSVACQAAEKAEVSTIFTTATLAIILKDYLKRYPNLERSLKFFKISGEVITPAKKKILNELFPELEFYFSYGAAETGRRAYQCRYLARRKGPVFYHPALADYHFEIVDPETGRPVIFGEKGELVLTDFCNRATPLIRYKTGDLANFCKNDCPCGAPGPLLQVWGRINYDSVRAGGFEIRKDMLEKPLINLSDCVKEDFEAHIYESFANNKPRIKVILNLSLKEGISGSPWLKKTIIDEFLKNWQFSPRLNLKAAIEAGLFDPLEINFVDFPQSPKTKGVLILH